MYRALAGGAVAVGVALGLAELDGDADDEGLDFGEADGEAEADGEGEALAPPEFAPASCLAPDACPVPPDAEGLGDAAGLADDLAAGDLDADALDADALGEDEPDEILSNAEESLLKLGEARARIKAAGREIRLEIDGGVKVENAASIAQAGADTFVSGSAIFGSADYARTIAAMRAQIEMGGKQA